MTGQNPRQSKYLLRVSSRVKFIISEVLHREIHDPRIGFLTVLAVEPTEDLKEAKVFVSVLGSQADKAKAQRALESATGFIQRRVAQGLKTRNTPALRFLFDDSQDKASRLEALIRKATHEDRETQMAKKPPKKPVSPEDSRSEKPSKKPGKKDRAEFDEEGEDAETEKVEDKSSDAKDEDFEADFEADADAEADVGETAIEEEEAVEEEYEEDLDEEDEDDDFLDDDEDEEEEEEDDFEEKDGDKYDEEYQPDEEDR
jgi:ribosome-binding factor A